MQFNLFFSFRPSKLLDITLKAVDDRGSGSARMETHYHDRPQIAKSAPCMLYF